MAEILITLRIERLDEGGYLATSPHPPGLIAQGGTVAETIGIAQDVAKKRMESYGEHAGPLASGVTGYGRIHGKRR